MFFVRTLQPARAVNSASNFVLLCDETFVPALDSSFNVEFLLEFNLQPSVQPASSRLSKCRLKESIVMMDEQ